MLVVEGEGWHQGVIGIVASRLVEKYGKPCIVISKNGDIAKGSGRSIDGFSLYDALSFCGDILTQFGGHVLAAGLTVDSDKIGAFRDRINEYAQSREAVIPTLKIDCKLNPSSINTETVESLRVLEPYGAENPQPLFGIYNMEITAVQPVGAGKHLRITVKRNNNYITVIMFSVSLEEFPYKTGDVVDLAVKLGENEYQGKLQVSVQAKAIKFSNSNDDEVMKSLNDYEDFCAGLEISSEKREDVCIDREFCGNVYKYIKANNGWNYSAEVLCFRLGLPPRKIAACRISLDVLTELGILILKDGRYILPPQTVKNPLDNSGIFRKASK